MSINKKLKIISEKVGAECISIDIDSYNSAPSVWVLGNGMAHKENGGSGEKLSQTIRRAIESAKVKGVI